MQSLSPHWLLMHVSHNLWPEELNTLRHAGAAVVFEVVVVAVVAVAVVVAVVVEDAVVAEAAVAVGAGAAAASLQLDHHVGLWCEAYQ